MYSQTWTYSRRSFSSSWCPRPGTLRLCRCKPRTAPRRVSLARELCGSCSCPCGRCGRCRPGRETSPRWFEAWTFAPEPTGRMARVLRWNTIWCLTGIFRSRCSRSRSRAGCPPCRAQPTRERSFPGFWRLCCLKIKLKIEQDLY